MCGSDPRGLRTLERRAVPSSPGGGHSGLGGGAWGMSSAPETGIAACEGPGGGGHQGGQASLATTLWGHRAGKTCERAGVAWPRVSAQLASGIKGSPGRAGPRLTWEHTLRLSGQRHPPL